MNFLINYLEKVTKSDVKYLELNATVFVIDKSLSEYSKWNQKEFLDYFENNSDNIWTNNRIKLNCTEILLLLSCGGPMFLDVVNISNLLHKLYKGDLEYVVKLYWYMNYIKNGENKDVAALVKALKRGGYTIWSL